MSFLSKDSSGLSQKQVNAPRWHFEGYLQISCNHLCWKPWPILIFRVPGLSFKGSSVAWGWISKGATRAAFFSRPIVFFVKSCCLLFGLHTGTYEMLEKCAHFKIWLVVSFSRLRSQNWFDILQLQSRVACVCKWPVGAWLFKSLHRGNHLMSKGLMRNAEWYWNTRCGA